MIIVTGGAGFIGSNLIKGLNDGGETDIIIVDSLMNAAKHLNLNRLKFRDLIDKNEYIEDPARYGVPTAIFHQGACSDTTQSDGLYMLKNNYEYSKRLLHFALDHKVPFLYASSASVYGNGDNGFTETERCENPLNLYAFTKFLFDNYVRRAAVKPASQILGLRYFNVYGPQENHKGRMASVAFHFFTQKKQEGKMQIFAGSDKFLRDFIHVDDVVAANLHFWQSGKSGILNCGTGEARSFEDIAKIIGRLSPAPSQIEIIPFPEDLKGKYQAYTQAELKNLQAAGYSKKFLSLEDGLARYYKTLSTSGGYYK